jgi:alpha-glucosidase
MQLSLRGSPCIYQGDELGLPEVAIAYEDLQDPYGITMWPEFKGRDGCRTPMPWVQSAPDLGFAPAGKAYAKPWLPVAETHRPLAVDAQVADPDSLLQYYRHLLHWRKTQPALLQGEMELLPVHAQVFAFVRATEDARVLCVFNFSDLPARYDLPSDCKVARHLTDSGLTGANLLANCVELAPWGGLFARLT